MKFSNVHTHTVFCDGKNTPEEMIERAQELGFVDGVVKECVLSEDGFSLDVMRALYRELAAAPAFCRL